MASVNFLSADDDGDEIRKKDEEKEEKVEWTEPVKEKVSPIPSLSAVNPEKPSGRFSFFKKKKKEIKKREVQEKFKSSRREILDIIKKEKKDKPSFFGNLFKRKNLDISKVEEIPTDYHHVINSSNKNNGAVNNKKEEAPKNTIKDIRPAEKNAYSDIPKAQPILSPSVKEKSEAPQTWQAEKRGADSHAGKEKPLIVEKTNGKTPDWENPELLETNLVKGEAVSFFNFKRGFITLAIYVVLAGAVVAGAYGGVSYWGERQKGKEEVSFTETEELKKEISLLEEDAAKIRDFQNRFKLTSELFDRHVYWTNFFNFLEDNTIKDVYYLSFKGDIGGKYALDSRAKNFQALVSQLNIMRSNENVSEVKIKGGSLSAGEQEGESGTSFNFGLSIRPEIFFK